MPDVDKTKISMYELLICLTNASDLISAEVADHHQQVAYLAFRIGERLDLPPAHKKDLALAPCSTTSAPFRSTNASRLSKTNQTTTRCAAPACSRL